MNLIVNRLNLVGVIVSLLALRFSHNASAQGSLTPPGAPADANLIHSHHNLKCGFVLSYDQFGRHEWHLRHS